MASALALRDDFTAARMRALARSSRDANLVRRLLALATIYEGDTRSPVPDSGEFGKIAASKLHVSTIPPAIER